MSQENELHFRVKFVLITCSPKVTPLVRVNFPGVRTEIHVHIPKLPEKIELQVRVRVTVRMGLRLVFLPVPHYFSTYSENFRVQ